ncbi:hypothetical protein HMPREF3199_00272 [Enterococcus faecium]|nr:hypothetical protein HMPREF3199_00272 [Enterococcus faecium]
MFCITKRIFPFSNIERFLFKKLSVNDLAHLFFTTNIKKLLLLNTVYHMKYFLFKMIHLLGKSKVKTRDHYLIGSLKQYTLHKLYVRFHSNEFHHHKKTQDGFGFHYTNRSSLY